MPTTFSVIVPTYNRGYTLWKTIQSIQKQQYPFWELIIADDGSEDDTAMVVAQFQYDPRIKYKKLPHRGAQPARNYGLKHSTGDIVAYVDSDDTVYENFLAVAHDFFSRHPKAVFATANYNRRLEMYDQNHKLVDFFKPSSGHSGTVTLQDYFHWNVKPCGTGIFHRGSIKKAIEWDVSMPRLQDWDFILQLGTKYPKGYLPIPVVLLDYAQRYGIPGICSEGTYEEWAKAFERIYEKYKDHPLMQGQSWYPSRVEKYLDLSKKMPGEKVSPLKV